jgi:rhodanese-related sulfurtransferase
VAPWDSAGSSVGRQGSEPDGGVSLRSKPVGSDYTPQQVANLLEQGGIQLIDVREPPEWEAGRIAGSRHLPLGDLAAEAATIDRDVPVVFYCRSGTRSAMAAQALTGAGWEAHNMAGGLLDWAAAGLPLEPADGYVAG